MDREPAFFPDPTLGMVGLDSGGRITAWGGAASAILGYDAEAVLGRPAGELLASDADRPAVVAAARRCRMGESVREALAVRHHDGGPVELLVRSWPVATGARDVHWHLCFAEMAKVRRWDTDRAVIEGLFAQAPIGLAVLDTRLCFVRVNDALERIHGIPRKESLGRRISALFPGPETDLMEARQRRVLETGKPLTTEHRASVTAAGEGHRGWSITSFRLVDPRGTILGVASAVVDVTERNRARDRLMLLDEAARRIGTTLDVTRTAAELADVAVPRLADYIAVDLLRGIALGEESGPGPVGGGAVLRRAAICSLLKEAPEASYPVGELITFHQATPQARAMADGRSVLLPTLEDSEEWLAQDPHRAGKMIAAGIHSVMVIPLRARDVTLGVAHFYRWQRPEPFEDDDITVAEELVARAAVCVDNARRYTRERHTAITLQQSLLRTTTPENSAATTVCRHLPAIGPTGVGGDWFDVIPLSGARLGLIVGDVPGRGIHAVANAARLGTAVRALAQQDASPDELLTQLDDIVTQAAEEAEHHPEAPTAGIGTTCLYAIYDPVSRRCALAGAAHLPPVLVKPSGAPHLLDLRAGPPLGLGGMPFETTDVDVPEGSTLALYTNGLLHGEGRHHDIDAALRTLCRTLTHSGNNLEQVCDTALDALLPSRAPHDDAVLLLARTHALGPDRVATWDLPPDPAIVGQARSLTSTQLAAWDLEELAFTTELIVSELVTNAIRYGRAPIQLRLIRATTLVCEVSDASSTSPHMRQAADTDENGRGLFMIAQMADRWGTRHSLTGKTIWAECGALSSTAARRPGRRDLRPFRRAR
ncbi:SpoIIE family protein phosphatase [Streptomyces broussonetiae]|uniref:SpoIIE family protein phosphatase n=1 Tax=Streptomyces broussonetiae TaxID=2686304 RepID=UPI0035D575EA